MSGKIAKILASFCLALFFLSVDLKYLPLGLALFGVLFFVIVLLVKSGLKLPLYLFKAIITCLFIISYAGIIDLLQGKSVAYDFRHVGNISIVISSLLIGHVYYLLYPKEKCDDIIFNIIRVFAMIVTANSLAILIQILQPEFRVAVEAILVESNRTDYLDGIRYRGFASAGGATLSIAMALTIAISVHMANANLMNWYLTSTIALVNLCALIFVGRTGLLLVAVLILAEIIRALKRFDNVIISSVYFIAFFSFFYLSVTLGGDGQYIDTRNYWHAFGIISKIETLGIAGSVAAEGTVPYLLDFYRLPEKFHNLIFGIGNFTGGYIEKLPGDPGVMKLMTLLGLPGMIVVYSAIIVIAYVAIKNAPINKSVIILIAIVLITLEIKEPFLWKGASSKLLWILIGVCLSARTHAANNQAVKFSHATN